VYLTCSKKLTGSQLSPPHGTNEKLKCETKNNEKIGPNRTTLIRKKLRHVDFQDGVFQPSWILGIQ